MSPIEGFLTTTEAGEKLGIKRARVIALIKAGRLPATKFGNIWLIKEDDLQFIAVRKPGRPRLPMSKSPQQDDSPCG